MSVHLFCAVFYCDLSGCTVFFPRYFMKGTLFGKKITDKMRVLFFYNFCLKHFSF